MYTQSMAASAGLDNIRVIFQNQKVYDVTKSSHYTG